MTCREVIEFLNEYVDGELSAEVRGRFDEHLRGCRECVEYLRGYRGAIGAAKWAEGEERVPVPEGVVRAILAARGKAGSGK